MVRLIRTLDNNISTSSTVHQWLVASSFFSLLLLLVRMALTGSVAYGFLAWNLVLAFVPYLVSNWLIRTPFVLANKKKLVLALATWLLFVPNSFYIITDLFHLDHFSSAPKWFDLVLILSFAWNGIICGLLSLRRVENIISLIKGRNASLVLVYGVMCLNAFGIYIGRFLRYNSWDVITNPFALFGEIADIIFHPLQNFPAWGMTLCYSVFMTFLYYTIKKMSESFILNNNNLKSI